jgi:hypothetical protein
MLIVGNALTVPLTVVVTVVAPFEETVIIPVIVPVEAVDFNLIKHVTFVMVLAKFKSA